MSHPASGPPIPTGVCDGPARARWEFFAATAGSAPALVWSLGAAARPTPARLATAPRATAAVTKPTAAAPWATTPAAPARTTTIFARPGQVDGQLAIAEPIAVEHRDGFLGFSLRAHFNKAKTFR